MADDNSDQGVSGNRWEPDAKSGAQPIEDPTDETTAAVLPSRPTWWTRTTAVVAGGAAAVLLVGGLGGFAIGHATAGTDDGGPGTQQQGVPTGFDGDGDGQGPGGPGRGPMTGQLPDGQVPDMPGRDDGQDDSPDGTDSSNT